MFILVTGGARSGRSNYALRRAAELGPPPWIYVSGGEETDETIRKRIDRQRRDNEAVWRTAPKPTSLVSLLADAVKEGAGALVIDGLVEWLGGRLGAIAAGDAAGESALLAEIAELAEKLARTLVPTIVVSQELGQGVPPAEGSPEQRLLRLVAVANQILAEQATALVMMVSGMPLRVR